jgi:hypothetical protein
MNEEILFTVSVMKQMSQSSFHNYQSNKKEEKHDFFFLTESLQENNKLSFI